MSSNKILYTFYNLLFNICKKCLCALKVCLGEPFFTCILSIGCGTAFPKNLGKPVIPHFAIMAYYVPQLLLSVLTTSSLHMSETQKWYANCTDFCLWFCICNIITLYIYSLSMYFWSRWLLCLRECKVLKKQMMWHVGFLVNVRQR